MHLALAALLLTAAVAHGAPCAHVSKACAADGVGQPLCCTSEGLVCAADDHCVPGNPTTSSTTPSSTTRPGATSPPTTLPPAAPALGDNDPMRIPTEIDVSRLTPPGQLGAFVQTPTGVETATDTQKWVIAGIMYRLEIEGRLFEKYALPAGSIPKSDFESDRLKFRNHYRDFNRNSEIPLDDEADVDKYGHWRNFVKQIVPAILKSSSTRQWCASLFMPTGLRTALALHVENDECVDGADYVLHTGVLDEHRRTLGRLDYRVPFRPSAKWLEIAHEVHAIHHANDVAYAHREKPTAGSVQVALAKFMSTPGLTPLERTAGFGVWSFTGLRDEGGSGYDYQRAADWKLGPESTAMHEGFERCPTLAADETLPCIVRAANSHQDAHDCAAFRSDITIRFGNHGISTVKGKKAPQLTDLHPQTCDVWMDCFLRLTTDCQRPPWLPEPAVWRVIVPPAAPL